MARVEIGEVVDKAQSVNGPAGTILGRVIGAGLNVQVNVRGGGAATVYQAATGASTRPNPLLSDANGRIEGYLEQGSYDLVVSGTGITTYTQEFEATSGASAAAVESRSLSGAGSPEGVVTASPGATYQQTNGAEGATLWIKETGAGNTGWRLARRLVQVSYELYGADPRAARAMQGDALVTAYAFPWDALSASAHIILGGQTGRVLYAEWNVVWTPNAAACGVELVKFDGGPANILQLAEATGSASTTPIVSSAVLTSAWQTLLGEAGAVGASKFIGQRVKGNGTVAPVVFANRIAALLEL